MNFRYLFAITVIVSLSPVAHAETLTIKPLGIWINENDVAIGTCNTYPDRARCKPESSVSLSDLLLNYSDMLLDKYNDKASDYRYGLNADFKTSRPNFKPKADWLELRDTIALSYIDVLREGKYTPRILNDEHATTLANIASGDVLVWLDKLLPQERQQVEVIVPNEFNSVERQNLSMGLYNQELVRIKADLGDKSPILVTPIFNLSRPIDFLLPMTFDLKDCPASLKVLSVSATNVYLDRPFFLEGRARDTERTFGIKSLQFALQRMAADPADLGNDCEIIVRTVSISDFSGLIPVPWEAR